MSINFIPVICPRCGSNLEVEENRDTVFCQYCGTKIMIHNENEYEYHYVHRDEAAIKQAETDRIVRMRMLEIEEEKRQEEISEQRKKKKSSIKLAICGVVVSILGFFLAELSGNPDSAFYFIGLIGLAMIAPLFKSLWNDKQQ